MAKPSVSLGLSRLELRIMQVLWKRGGCTVGTVRNELKPALAYNTVQTVLNILERKGRLKRELRGRAYTYSPTISESKALGQVVRDVIDRVFGGSSEELVMSLLKNRQIDAKRLAKLTDRFHQETDKS